MIVAPATASIARTIAQNHQYSQPIVKPARGPERRAAVLDERPDRRVGDRHLAEHPHDEDDEGPGQQVGHHRRRARLVHDRAAADEEARADHPAQGDHGHVALAQ
jgi:hypothetical protein